MKSKDAEKPNISRQKSAEEYEYVLPRIPRKQSTEEYKEYVSRSLVEQAKYILELCTHEAPATILDVQFPDGYLSISVRWPFSLQPIVEEKTTQEADPWDLLDPRSQKLFLSGFRDYLLEQHAGRRLSNLLYAELRAFVGRFLRAHRFGHEAVAAVGQIGERRLSGRPVQTIGDDDAAKIRRDGPAIVAAISAIRSEIERMSDKRRLAVTGTHIVERYDRDKYSWMRSFLPAFEELHGRPHIYELTKWSAVELAVAILRKEFYRERGRDYPARAVKTLIEGPSALSRGARKKN